MTDDEHVQMQNQLWIKAFRELDCLSILDVRYHECIAREVKDCINEQLLFLCDDSKVAKLTGVAEMLGQFVENEKSWFDAMMVAVRAEKAANNTARLLQK